jgi:cupin superfamily acireductone dioxygenase involved in methionine salvage
MAGHPTLTHAVHITDITTNIIQCTSSDEAALPDNIRHYFQYMLPHTYHMVWIMIT